MEEARLEHLKMIQTVITRMAQNSFLLKGWSVTLVSAMITLTLSNADPRGRWRFTRLQAQVLA